MVGFISKGGPNQANVKIQSELNSILIFWRFKAPVRSAKNLSNLLIQH